MASPSSSGLRIRPTDPNGAFTYTSFGGARPIAAGQAPAAVESTGLTQCAQGPWGEIEYHYVYLEASEQLVSHFSLPSPQPRWSFPGATRERLAAFFDAARVPADWIDLWLSPNHLLSEAGVLHVLIPLEHLE